MSVPAMRLALAIEASDSTYCVALGSGEEPVIQLERQRHDAEFKGLGHLVALALEQISGRFTDITSVGVDVGPGNYSSVRAAVSYVNGLAYSLAIPIYCTSSLRLMAIRAFTSGVAPPILCLQRGPAGNMYAALFTDHEQVSLKYGMLDSVVAGITSEVGQLAVAGALRNSAADLIGGMRWHDTKIERPDVVTLYKQLSVTNRHSDSWAAIASPLNEASKVFRRR